MKTSTKIAPQLLKSLKTLISRSQAKKLLALRLKGQGISNKTLKTLSPKAYPGDYE